ncbi:O-methyltransferase, putative [Aspergillus udagawae]|nr:O-methyltransferase, putative [Aspergillus udagawae]
MQTSPLAHEVLQLLQQSCKRLWINSGVRKRMEMLQEMENLGALQNGRVQLVEYSFFDITPTEGADIYFLRYVLHDWSDEDCVCILSAIRPTPSPLPANYGYHTRFSHSRDITMMSCINGVERMPAEVKALLQVAGLKLNDIGDRAFNAFTL